MKRGGTGEIVVSNLDATWLFVFVLNHRFCLNSAKRPAAGHGLKTIKRPAARYFSIFLFEIQIFIWNVLFLFTILKRFHAAQNFELDTFRQPCIQSTKLSKRLTLRNF